MTKNNNKKDIKKKNMLLQKQQPIKKPIYVREFCEYIYSTVFSGLITGTIKYMQDIQKEYEKKGYRNIVIEKYDYNRYAIYGEREQ